MPQRPVENLLLQVLTKGKAAFEAWEPSAPGSWSGAQAHTPKLQCIYQLGGLHI